MTEKELNESETSSQEEEYGDIVANSKKVEVRPNKKKKLILKEVASSAADKRGVCYLSRIPPRMDPTNLRQILSQYGEIERIYLAPQKAAVQVKRKQAVGFRGQVFSEGWVEFTKKNVAKRVADMLNGEQIGGKKKSSFFYDIWNIKYLSKFKWDDLTEETAYKHAVREQKLTMALSAAKRERDSYMSKVEKSRALSEIQDRLVKKQKKELDLNSESQVVIPEPKVIRQFPQTKPVGNTSTQRKSQLSKDILAGVFGGSS